MRYWKGEGKGGKKLYSHLPVSDPEEEDLVLFEKGVKGKEEKRKEEKVPLYKLVCGGSCGDMVRLLVGVVAAVLHGAGPPLLAIIFGSMTDAFIGTRRAGEEEERSPLSIMHEFTIYYIGLGAWVLVTTVVQAHCWESHAEKQVYRLRISCFQKIMKLGIPWYDEQETGKLCSQLTDDLERVREGLGHKCSYMVQYGTNTVLGFLVGFWTNWQLALLFTFLSPFLVFTAGVAGSVMATGTQREQSKYGDAGARAQEVLSSIRTVSAFGGEGRELRKYRTSLKAALLEGRKKLRWVTRAHATIGLLTYLTYAAGIWYGVQLLLQHEITPGQIFTVLFSALSGAFAIGSMLPFVASFGAAQGAALAPFNIIETPVPAEESSIIYDTLVPELVNGEIEFDVGEFAYPSRPEVNVIKDLRLTIGKGQRVAFVGSSGAGKSTILSLLIGFYEPTFGSVFIDGVSLKYIRPDLLRQSIIGVVSQETSLFSLTIFENIALGGAEGKVSFGDVVKAAQLANAHDFISNLPHGYYTVAGEGGSQLSTGQRQRILIARAIVGNPRILLLDEATSALDLHTEKQVHNALQNVMKDRTTVIVSHRLNTVREADQIYFLRNGSIVESGTHEDLMALKSHYHKHVMSQEVREEGTAGSSPSPGETEGKEDSNLYGRGCAGFRVGSDEEAGTWREVEAPGLLGSILFLRPEWEFLSIGMIGCVIVGAVPVLFAYLFGILFHVFSYPKELLEREGHVISGMFALLALLSGIGMWMRNYMSKTAEELAFRLRLESFQSILRQPMAWFEDKRNSPGNLLTRLSADAGVVKGAASHRLGLLATGAVTILMSLGLAFLSGWELALVLTSVYPLIVFGAFVASRARKGGSAKFIKLKENSGRIAVESISNLRAVMELGKERQFIGAYNRSLLKVYQESWKEAWFYSLLIGFSEAITFATYALGFRVGAHLVETNLMTIGGVYQVFFAVAFSAPSIGQTISLVPDYKTAKEAFKQILTIIQSHSLTDPFSSFGERPLKVFGSIEFDNVEFTYPQRPSAQVLSGINFRLKAGQTLGIVGDSGGGKSTIINLLERFYDPSKGKIRIDGIEAQEWNLAHLRRSIGYVSQDPFLFNSTIYENIAYGYKGPGKELSQAQVEDAARIANAHDFIVQLPEAYQTICGERGVFLSGGQKQRIAIARAVLRDPKILLLDEATSSLDPVSEQLVQAGLENAKKGRTCIIIAHRLSTIQSADHILVIRGGCVAEEGTHEELLSQKGIYYSLVQTDRSNHINTSG